MAWSWVGARVSERRGLYVLSSLLLCLLKVVNCQQDLPQKLGKMSSTDRLRHYSIDAFARFGFV